MTRFLAACRYLLIVPVIGCLILTAGTVIMGIVRIVTAGAGRGVTSPTALTTALAR